METQFTEEQKKKIRAQILLASAVSVVLTFGIMMFFFKKETDKLEAKIFKLEGWQ
ncbi:MAG TPA: hypothetical protein PKC54_01025 [Ferruginibacter sp.]|nr:hypothetical protein [Ferruginibacter sp.]